MSAAAALARFARDVRAAYGARVRLDLFGSRARGDAGADSDIDVAVVLDAVGDRWAERERLWELAYKATVEHGVHVQPWPVTEAEWRDAGLHSNPALVRAMRRDGVPVP